MKVNFILNYSFTDMACADLTNVGIHVGSPVIGLKIISTITLNDFI